MFVQVLKKPVNAQALDAAIRAAVPGYEGYAIGAKWPDHVRLLFADGTPQAQIDTALALYAAHDPNVLTPEQALQARRLAAMGDVETEDFAALLNQINAATSLADAKPILRKLLALTYRMALATELTNAPGPGA